MSVRRIAATCACALLLLGSVSAAMEGDWPYGRGPDADGMARGDAPLRWSDPEHIAWKTAIQGRGHSSPVVWGDRIFLTSAAPSGTAGRGSGGGLIEHRFLVLCL